MTTSISRTQASAGMISKLKVMRAAAEGIPASAEIKRVRRQQQREPLHCLQLQEHLLEHGCQQQGCK
jgi:hypothetical protein